jgi:hypothetical protein
MKKNFHCFQLVLQHKVGSNNIKVKLMRKKMSTPKRYASSMSLATVSPPPPLPNTPSSPHHSPPNSPTPDSPYGAINIGFKRALPGIYIFPANDIRNPHSLDSQENGFKIRQFEYQRSIEDDNYIFNSHGKVMTKELRWSQKVDLTTVEALKLHNALTKLLKEKGLTEEELFPFEDRE